MSLLVALASKKRLLKNEEDGKFLAHESMFFNAKVAIITGTTHATATNESTHAHGLQVTPEANMVFFTAQDKSGSIYISSAPDGTNIKVKCDVNAVAFTALIIYLD